MSESRTQPSRPSPPIRYVEDPTRVPGLFGYLRNKNVDVQALSPSLRLRLWNRVHRMVLARQRKALLSASPELVVSEQIIENALVLRYLPDPPLDVLDFGGVESSARSRRSATG